MFGSAAGCCTGCCMSREDSRGAESEAASDTIRMAGSTSMQRLANALAESFMDQYPNMTVTVEFVGSGAGIEAVTDGGADIGNSSRGLREEEKAAGAVENVVALDGIAVCVDPANTVQGLTVRQLKDIYTGKIKNWSEVGGEEIPIVVIGREAGSGTREDFETFLEAKDSCTYVNELDSNGAVLARVALTAGAIGYVSMANLSMANLSTANMSTANMSTANLSADNLAVNGSVRALSLDGVAPTAENIRAGSYLLTRPFVMVTKGEISKQREQVQAWFDYVYGQEGQSIAVKVGLIAVE